MFDDIFKFLFKAVDVSPRYQADHCLAVKQSVAACHICRDVCPHDAITIKKRVEIDEVDCTGCGLCVRHCPSQALETTVRTQAGAAAKCSQVGGDAQTVHCLARLGASDLLRLAGRSGALTLVRNSCASCKIGTAAVIDALEATRAEAEALAAVRGRSFALEVVETERFDAPASPEQVSRRDLLRGGWRSVQLGAADALAPFDPGGDEDDSLPAEMQRRYRIIEAAAPEPDAQVPWVLPRVAEGCIMCPVCTNVCPTRAFGRNFSPAEGDAALELDPERCMGCNACVAACPVKVISLETPIRWQELSGGRQVAYLSLPKGPRGSVAR